MNIPEYNRLVNPNTSVNETHFRNINVSLKNPRDEKAIKRLTEDFKKAAGSDNIHESNYFKNIEVMDEIDGYLGWIFGVIISITMFMCFFSLCSSMSANLMDQTKEIGIILAMGMTKNRIKMLYFYEAFILVSSSSILGVMIGTIVSFFMVLQQSMIT